MVASLADDVVAAIGTTADEDSRGGFSLLAQEVIRSERFALSPEAAYAAWSVSQSKIETLAGALPMARAPYKRMWIEYSYREMMALGAESILADDPNRVGYLVEDIDGGWLVTGVIDCKEAAARDGYPRLAIMPFQVHVSLDSKFDLPESPRHNIAYDHATGWSVAMILPRSYKKRYPALVSKAVADFSQAEFDQAGYMLEVSQSFRLLCPPCLRTIHHEWYRRVLDNDFPKDRLYGMAQATIDCVPHVVAVLLLLNSRNIGSAQEVSFDRLNRKRRVLGRKPLLSYKTVDLSLSRVQGNRTIRGSGSGAVRKHLVRGHFKLRKTGVYWWSNYVRGTAPGEVKHTEYRVRA